MTIDFYYSPVSGPCRAIILLCKTLGVELNLKFLDLATGAHMTPEFLKLNYQHTIPTLVDNGFSLWESRAILAYLVEKYGKNDALFPKDPQKRARVNQMLYFDMGTLYQRLAECYYKPIFNKTPVEPENLKKVQEAIGFLNTALEGKKYVAGDTLTIADFAIVVTTSMFEGLKFDFTKYPNVAKWYDMCKKTLPGYEINQKGIDEFVQKYGSQIPN